METRRERWSAVMALVRPDRARLASLAVTSLLAGILEAAFLALVTVCALAVAEGESATSILGHDIDRGVVLTAAAGALVIRLAMILVNVRLATDLTIRASTRLRYRMATAFLSASWAIQHGEPAGHLQQLLSDFAQKTIGVLKALTAGVTAALSLVALIVAALVVSPVATVVVVLLLGGVGSALTPIRGRVRRRSAAAAAITMRFANAVAELGALGMEMQAFGRGPVFTERVNGLVDEEAGAWRRADWLRNTVGPLYTSIGYAALLLGLVLAVAVGFDEVAAVSVVVLLVLRCLGYGQALQVASTELVNSLPYLEAYNLTLERYEGDPAPDGDVVVDTVAPIEARDVSFSYVPGRPVLEDVSFRIAAGEMIGIVGPSGGGKSTIVQLLLGLRVPTAGTIEAGGVPVAAIDRACLTTKVAFVPQEAHLVAGTIAENIRFFRSGIDDDRVEDAARRAGLHRDVMGMSEGYDTPIGERGGNLSGGQRQRLSIARALVGRPELIILDEPTSALDLDSERIVRDTLAALRGEVTAVVIAHRLTTVEVCDRLMVIEGGRMKGFDTSEALARSNPFFRRALELSKLP